MKKPEFKHVLTVETGRAMREVREVAKRANIDLDGMSDIELYDALKALHKRGMTEAARLGLPARLHFEGIDGTVAPRKYRYEYLGYRAPKKGEYFISGAIPQAYKAHNEGITLEYHICKPILED